MARRDGFRVLVATDGSAPARAAVAAAALFPWPAGSRASGVLARWMPVGPEWPPSVWAALERSSGREATRTRDALQRRWPDAEVAVVDRPPVDAILSEARRVRAGAIVLGSRGHGALSRLVLGSVSLGVVRRTPCAALVVRGRPRATRHLALGLDASAHARRAVDFVAGLAAPRGGRVTLVAVVEPIHPPAMGLLPRSARAVIGDELAALEAERAGAARRRLETAGHRLAEAGWKVATDLRTGVPLAELLAGTAAARADVLVVGARGIGGVERLLLGSVAEGALHRSPVPVLVVR